MRPESGAASISVIGVTEATAGWACHEIRRPLLRPPLSRRHIVPQTFRVDALWQSSKEDRVFVQPEACAFATPVSIPRNEPPSIFTTAMSFRRDEGHRAFRRKSAIGHRTRLRPVLLSRVLRSLRRRTCCQFLFTAIVGDADRCVGDPVSQLQSPVALFEIDGIAESKVVRTLPQ
jgi:hypothetical protein